MNKIDHKSVTPFGCTNRVFFSSLSSYLPICVAQGLASDKCIKIRPLITADPPPHLVELDLQTTRVLQVCLTEDLQRVV